jgi:hypothetical protein
MRIDLRAKGDPVVADYDRAAAVAETGATAIAYRPVVCVLDATGFDGVETTFTDLLPFEPDLVGNDVVLIHSGIGSLKRVASSPGDSEFSLSGGTNRTPTFGLAPNSGDYIHAIFVAA